MTFYYMSTEEHKLNSLKLSWDKQLNKVSIQKLQIKGALFRCFLLKEYSERIYNFYPTSYLPIA